MLFYDQVGLLGIMKCESLPLFFLILYPTEGGKDMGGEKADHSPHHEGNWYTSSMPGSSDAGRPPTRVLVGRSPT